MPKLFKHQKHVIHKKTPEVYTVLHVFDSTEKVDHIQKHVNLQLTKYDKPARVEFSVMEGKVFIEFDYSPSGRYETIYYTRNDEGKAVFYDGILQLLDK